jgi:hypothetical protein
MFCHASGFLSGKAPVLNLFPSIALQQFADCQVAVKTVPQPCSENELRLFRIEIKVMKDIGYHIHLVSMLGCNSVIERPFLIMELADQDLLRWLVSISTSPLKTDVNLQKKLLSIAWQISDGMVGASLIYFQSSYRLLIIIVKHILIPLVKRVDSVPTCSLCLYVQRQTWARFFRWGG